MLKFISLILCVAFAVAQEDPKASAEFELRKLIKTVFRRFFLEFFFLELIENKRIENFVEVTFRISCFQFEYHKIEPTK